jgi:hypothetical protein
MAWMTRKNFGTSYDLSMFWRQMRRPVTNGSVQAVYSCHNHRLPAQSLQQAIRQTIAATAVVAQCLPRRNKWISVWAVETFSITLVCRRAIEQASQRSRDRRRPVTRLPGLALSAGNVAIQRPLLVCPQALTRGVAVHLLRTVMTMASTQNTSLVNAARDMIRRIA